MGKSVNRVTLLGNLGRAPEVRTTGGGTTVAQFSIATTRGVKDARGQWQDVTEWHSCVAFGKLAEVLRDYTDKGHKLYVEGRLQTRSWEKDGAKQYRTEIVAEQVVLIGGNSIGQKAVSDAVEEQRGRAYDYGVSAVADEDIPF